MSTTPRTAAMHAACQCTEDEASLASELCVKLETELAASQRENRHLRRIACVAHVRSLRGLYLDDGELQDSSARPYIDWRRMTIDQIETALAARGAAALKVEMAAAGVSTLQELMALRASEPRASA